jgi:hypothetical protein
MIIDGEKTVLAARLFFCDFHVRFMLLKMTLKSNLMLTYVVM